MGKPVVAGHCPKCGTYRQWLQRDHIVPRYLGGTNDPSNIQYLCANCHEDKSRVEASAAAGRRKPVVYTDEMRRHMSEAQKKRAPMSVETRAKLSASCKRAWTEGRMFDAEHRSKISRALKGRKLTDEHKAHLRRPRTDEQRARIRAAAQARARRIA